MPYKGKGKQRNSGVYGGVDDGAHLSDGSGGKGSKRVADAQSGPESHKAGSASPGGRKLRSKSVSGAKHGGMGAGKGY